MLTNVIEETINRTKMQYIAKYSKYKNAINAKNAINKKRMYPSRKENEMLFCKQ